MLQPTGIYLLDTKYSLLYLTGQKRQRTILGGFTGTLLSHYCSLKCALLFIALYCTVLYCITLYCTAWSYTVTTLQYIPTLYRKAHIPKKWVTVRRMCGASLVQPLNNPQSCSLGEQQRMSGTAIRAAGGRREGCRMDGIRGVGRRN